MYHTHVTRVLCLFLVAFFLLSHCCQISWGNNPLASGPQSLIEKYREVKKETHNNSFNFRLESSVGKHLSRVDLYSTIEYPFNIISNELQSPERLCNIVLLDVNVRACTYQKVDQTWVLTLYQVNGSNKCADAVIRAPYLC